MLYLLLVLGASAGFIILAFVLFVFLDSFRYWLVGVGFRLSGGFYRLSKKVTDWKQRGKVSSVSATKITEGTINASRISSITISDGQIKVGVIKASEIEGVNPGFYIKGPSRIDCSIPRDLLNMDDDFRETLRQAAIKRQQELQQAQEDKYKGGSAA